MQVYPSQSRFIWAVYALKDDGGAIRYIGVSKTPDRRLKAHIRGAKYVESRKSNWVKSLLKVGKKPVMELLEWTEDWDEAERRWVSLCREWGCRLVNGTDGGKHPCERMKEGRRNYPATANALRELGNHLLWMRRHNSPPEKIHKAERAIETIKEVRKLEKSHPGALALLEAKISTRHGAGNGR